MSLYHQKIIKQRMKNNVDNRTLCFSQLFIRRVFQSSNDKAFMGYTHALSVLAVALLCIAFVPGIVNKVLMTSSVAVIITFVQTTVGAGMIPDLDNTNSRAKSDLGVFGNIISGFFRVSSIAIQSVIRTKHDSPEPNPHRGFWHTIPAAVISGLLVYLGTKIGGHINIPHFGEVTWGNIVALCVIFILTHLTLSTLAKELMDKIKKSKITGELGALLVSFILSLVVFLQLPTDVDFWWLGISVAFGMFLHTFGDAFTTMGSPLAFPVPIKGKSWWNIRLLGGTIKAGGEVEKWVFTPTFIIIIIISMIKILLSL